MYFILKTYSCVEVIYLFIRSRCKRKTKFFLSNTNSRPTDRNGVYKKVGTHNTSKHTGLTSM